MSENKELECSFCGKSRDTVNKLIAGPNVYICNECITLSYKIVSNELETVEDDTDNFDHLATPAEIKEHFDEYIIGHNETKEMIAVCAYNHYKRINKITENEIQKSNVLLIGPTGTGKTLFAKVLSKKLDVPFAIADATTLTEAGYVGEDVESVLERLLVKANHDLELAQKGIIYIDEIDKKARRGENNFSTKDVSGEGVQQALLRLIEGTTTKVKISNQKKMSDEYVEFDTTDILFILGGAFVGIEKIIEKRIKSSTGIGFGANVIGNDDRDHIMSQLCHEDVVSYGLIPELTGRLPIIGVLDRLTENDMHSILKKVKNNVIEQAKELLLIDGIKLELDDQYYLDAAGLAIKEKLGARALKSIVDKSLIGLMFRAPELHNSGVVGIRFNKYPLTQNDKPVIIYENGTSEIDQEYRLYRGKYET